MKHLIMAAILGLPCFCTTANAAAGSATLQTFDPDGNAVTVQIEALDTQRLRLSSPEHPEGYLLMLGPHTYDVLQFGSLPIVVDAADMAEQLRDQLPAAPSPTDDIRKLLALEPTGQKETVAGIGGERYRLRYLDGNGQPHDEDLVAARDPLLHDLSLALYRLGTSMAGVSGISAPEGAERLARELDAKGLGLLRIGTRLRLLTVNRAVPSTGRFALPAEPVQGLQGLPGLSGLE